MKALEFYSGIGGMHYALKSVIPSAQVIAAFDINDVANDVYEHNFKFRPKQGTISSIQAQQLERLAAEIWMLSPPCQPYTRRGARRDAEDPRASSFLHLISLIPAMKNPPDYIIVENVVGFEGSQTRSHLATSLSGAGYSMQEFLLTPLQLGIPYSRPRYYAIARRDPVDGSPALPLAVPATGAPLRVPPLHLLAQDLQQATPAEQRPDDFPGESSASGARVSPSSPEAVRKGPLERPCERSSVCNLRKPQTLPNEAQARGSSGGGHQRERCSSPDRCPCSTCSHGAGTAGRPKDGCRTQAAPAEAGPALPDEDRAAHVVLPESLVLKFAKGVPVVPGPDSVAPLGDYLVSVPEGNTAVQETAAVAHNSRCGVGQASVIALEPGGEVEGDLGVKAGRSLTRSCTEPSGVNGEAEEDPWAQYRLPLAVLQQWGQALDVVSPASRRCNCFTRTYSRYTKGSGSVLATRNLHNLQYVEQKQVFAPGDMDLEPDLAPLASTAVQPAPRDWALDAQRIIAVPSSRCTATPSRTTGRSPEGERSGPAPGPWSIECGCAGESGVRNQSRDGDGNPANSTVSREPEGVQCEGARGDLECTDMADAQTGTRNSPCKCTQKGGEGQHEGLFNGCECCAGGDSAAPDLATWLAGLGVRYFAPREIANLHSFPADFSFPPGVSLRQQCALLGNSLSVAVVAHLLTYLFWDRSEVSL